MAATLAKEISAGRSMSSLGAKALGALLAFGDFLVRHYSLAARVDWYEAGQRWHEK